MHGPVYRVKRILPGFLVFIAIALCDTAVLASVIRVQAVVLRNDDGTRMAKVRPGELALWLVTANRTLKRSGSDIQLTFSPEQDWLTHTSSTLNGLHNYRPACLPLFAQARKIAAEHPQKLTVFFRHGSKDVSTDGSKERATGNGFAVHPTDTAPGFIVMPGFQSTTIKRGPKAPRLPNQKLFVHELGHFLGLKHTFPGNGSKQPKTLKDLRQRIKDAGAQTGAQGKNFDGDGIADTPPDPYTHLWFRFLKVNQCQSNRLHRIPGTETLRHNPMAYLNCPPYRFTAGQVKHMEQRLNSKNYAYLR